MAMQGALDKPSHSALPADALFQSNTLTYQLIRGAIHQTAHPVPRMTFISSFRFVKCFQSLYVVFARVCVCVCVCVSVLPLNSIDRFSRNVV